MIFAFIYALAASNEDMMVKLLLSPPPRKQVIYSFHLLFPSGKLGLLFLKCHTECFSFTLGDI